MREEVETMADVTLEIIIGLLILAIIAVIVIMMSGKIMTRTNAVRRIKDTYLPTP